MMTVTQIISAVLMAAGMFFLVISLVGIIRFPDFYTRLHAQGIGDTLSALLIIGAMMITTGAHLMSVKLLLIFIIIMVTNPLGTNLMMIAAAHMDDYLNYNEKKVSNEKTGEDAGEEVSSEGEETVE